MAKIVDPDQLNQATEVTFTGSTRTVDLAVAGNLNDTAPGKTSGVTHQALYSFGKEEWLATASLQKFPFPWEPIFEQKFDWVNDWQPNDAQTIDLIRDGGFRIALLNDEYACLISLQALSADTDASYYHRDSASRFTGTAQSFDKTGDLNEPWLIYDGTNDYRDFFKVFTRVQGKTYAYGDLIVDQDRSSITYQAYAIPLSNATDANVVASDATIDSTTPYTNMTIDYLEGAGFTTAAATTYSAGDVVQDGTGRWAFCVTGGTVVSPGGAYSAFGGTSTWEAYAGEEQIGTNYYAFNRVVNVSTGTATAQQFYEWMQRQLRKTGDINAATLGAPNQNSFGTMDGEFAMELAFYEGSTLVTQPGVIIRNFDANDTNSMKFQDITVDGGGLDQDSIAVTSTRRTFPFVAAGTLEFNSFLDDETDIDTFYTMFFQYTTRDTGTDIAVTSPSADTATLTSSTTDFTTHFTNGDYVRISGFTTNAVNNGLFQVNGAVTSTTMPVRKVNGETLIAETAGDSVNLDADPYGSPDAIIVDDNSGTDISGTITAASIAFDFDYDNNVQGGRTGGVPAPVVVYCMGKASAQWVGGLFTIQGSTGQSFPLNANQERVYLNPV